MMADDPRPLRLPQVGPDEVLVAVMNETFLSLEDAESS